MYLYYLLSIFILTEKLFFLLPWTELYGLLVDLGNVLIWIGLFDSLFRSRDVKVLNSSISLLLLILFLIIGVQISLSMIYYQQSLVGGFIGARNQLYYLSFFLFLFSLDDTKKIVRFLEMLSIVGIIVFILALINYFGPTVFYAEKAAEGVGIRSGITRAWFPGMMLLSFVGLWQYSKCTKKETFNTKSVVSTVLFLAAHIFRQTRTRTIALILLMGFSVILNRKYKQFMVSVVLGVLAVVCAQFFMEENILLSTFESAIEDVSEDSGTWGARTELARTQLEQFMKYPLLGDGQLALSGSMGEVKEGEIGKTKQFIKSTNVHQGYSSWVLSYGLLGAVWLICFIGSLYTLGRRGLRYATAEESVLLMFGMSYIGFIMITSIGLNHLQFPDGIVYACLAAAIIVRLIYNIDQTQRQRSGDDQNV